MTDILATIAAHKRTEVAARKGVHSESAQLALARAAAPPRGFARHLAARSAAGRFALIAEIKKASPSHGLIRPEFDPATLARAYRAGGATCLSVVTDARFFQGDDGNLKQAHDAVELPILRKDFMIDPYQIVESRALGADCILLIMACLDDTLAGELQSVANDLGMDVLVEIHDAGELQRALLLRPRLIGINNRNLKTLSVDLATTEQLAPLVPAGIEVVCESGLKTVEDLRRMRRIGVSRFLVGESLMRERDVQAATARLLGTAVAPQGSS